MSLPHEHNTGGSQPDVNAASPMTGHGGKGGGFSPFPAPEASQYSTQHKTQHVSADVAERIDLPIRGMSCAACAISTAGVTPAVPTFPLWRMLVNSRPSIF